MARPLLTTAGVDQRAMPSEPKRGDIPGIYHYCDRWCGRCPFADRCAVHAAAGHPDADGPPDPLLAHLRARFDSMAAASAGRPAAPDVAAAYADGITVGTASAEALSGRTHALVQDARTYAALVGAWFDTETSALCQRADDLARRVITCSPGCAPGPADLPGVIAAIEIVRHDAWLVPSKLARALHQDADAAAGTRAAIQNDRNGSVKVALLAMDRSEAAWRLVDDWLHTGSAALLAAHLAGLRALTERMFPDARRFLRPGFDLLPDGGGSTTRR